MKKNKVKSNVMPNLTKAVRNKTLKGIHPNAISKHVANLEENKPASKNMRSALEGKNLDEFLDLNKLSNKQYEVLNEQIVVQALNTNQNREIHQNQFSGEFLKNALKNTDIKLYETKPLSIPKRPTWQQGTSALEFERMEREAFLNWRRALAKEEESNVNYAITPFEKNIEVWRQLWLVVEKCQLLIQIVDGRNPMYFRCPDLDTYIQEVDKSKDFVLLINKADLMNDQVRKSWAEYFTQKGIKYVFFSALEEAKKIEDEIEKVNEDEEVEDTQTEDEEAESDDEDENTNANQNMFNKFKQMTVNRDEDDEDEIVDVNIEKNESNFNKDAPVTITTIEVTEIKQSTSIKEEEVASNIINENEINKEDEITPHKHTKTIKPILPVDESIKIHDRDELISLIKKITQKKEMTKQSKLSKQALCYFVGFIGYPNVGKSSVINVLMMKKKVGVAQMPGKTKHYQTLFLPTDPDFCLMDCPGLVFPSFTSSKGDMAVNGIISIDTLREFHTPIAIIVQKIPRRILEIFYKIELPDIYSATQFLQVLAAKRGFITGRSLPDEARTAKFILKDYVSGKLLYCNLRPDYNEELHGKIVTYGEDLVEESERDQIVNQEEREKMDIIREIPASFDDDFDKINIDVDTNRNLKTTVENFDSMYFNQIMNVEDLKNENKDKRMTKDMKRALKFAVKRGDITEEEYEDAMTYEDYDNIVVRITKETQANKKDLVGTKIIEIK